MTDPRRKYFNDDQIAEMDAGFPTRRHMAESAPLPRSEGAAPTTHDTAIHYLSEVASVLETRPPLGRADADSIAFIMRNCISILSKPAAPSDAGAPTPRCPLCRHAAHEPGRCLNMASDNECGCAAPVSPSDAPADRAAVSEDVAGLLKETTYWLERTRTFTFPRDVIERLATALRAATDRAEQAEQEAEHLRAECDSLRDRAVAALDGHIEAMRQAAYAEYQASVVRSRLEGVESRLATAIERVKQLPIYANEPELLDRAAVLSILTGEPDTHA